MEALMRISSHYKPQCYNNEVQRLRAFLETMHAIPFMNKDMEAPHIDHQRPLYFDVMINDVYIHKALVDTRQFAKVIPFVVSNATKILRSEIIKNEIVITGFEKCGGNYHKLCSIGSKSRNILIFYSFLFARCQNEQTMVCWGGHGLTSTRQWF